MKNWIMIANDIEKATRNKARMGIINTVSTFLSQNDLSYLKAIRILSNNDCENCRIFNAKYDCRLNYSCYKRDLKLNEYLNKKRKSYIEIVDKIIRDRKYLFEFKVIINKIILKQYEQTSKH